MTSTHVHVLGISGSLRAGSYNTAALRAAAAAMPEDMSFELAEIGDIPLYNADHERAAGFSPPVERFRSQIRKADALLIATPEYNFSVTGALKNAWDWASRPPDSPITLKPAAVLGVGGRLGATRAQQHFRDIALHNDLRMVQKPEVLIAAGWDKFDSDGNLTDERTADQIARLVLALRGLTLRIRATRRRVLVFDSDEANTTRLVGRLRELGYEPVAAGAVEEALDFLNPGSFHALIVGSGAGDDTRTVLADYVSRHAPATGVAMLDTPEGLVTALEEALAGHV